MFLRLLDLLFYIPTLRILPLRRLPKPNRIQFLWFTHDTNFREAASSDIKLIIHGSELVGRMITYISLHVLILVHITQKIFLIFTVRQLRGIIINRPMTMAMIMTMTFNMMIMFEYIVIKIFTSLCLHRK